MKDTLYKALTLNSKWVYGLPSYGLTKKITGMELPCDDIVAIIPATLCESIGKTDKKGKAVFEHDQLKFVRKLGRKSVTEILTVFYNADSAAFMLGSERCLLPLSMYDISTAEVVGNVFDKHARGLKNEKA